MSAHWLEIINPIKVTVAAVTVYGFLRLERSNSEHRLILAILVLAFCTELLQSILRAAGYGLIVSTNIGMIAFFILWLVVICGLSTLTKPAKALTILFMIYALLNISLLTGPHKVNFYTFILGSIIYISLFLVDTWRNFKDEKLEAFEQNNFILASAPIIFMACMSMMFAFRSLELLNTTIMDVELYSVVIYVINLIYYFLITAYIRGEKKTSHV